MASGPQEIDLLEEVALAATGLLAAYGLNRLLDQLWQAPPVRLMPVVMVRQYATWHVVAPPCELAHRKRPSLTAAERRARRARRKAVPRTSHQ